MKVESGKLKVESGVAVGHIIYAAAKIIFSIIIKPRAIARIDFARKVAPTYSSHGKMFAKRFFVNIFI